MKDDILSVFAIILLGYVVGFLFASNIKDYQWKKESVKHNHAEYVLNAVDGSVRWEWR